MKYLQIWHVSVAGHTPGVVLQLWRERAFSLLNVIWLGRVFLGMLRQGRPRRGEIW